MADLNSYEEVVQLGEDMEYPEGYNVVEIVGNGDSRQTRIWPTVTITGPTSLISDGTTVYAYEIKIFDPNADNPFYLGPNQFEAASVSSPQEMTVSNLIVRIHGVYEDQAKTKQVPPEYVVFTENKIAILDGWSADGADWDGLYLQQAWVEYDGQYGCAVEDGNQVAKRWWVRPGDDESVTERDVSGTLFLDPEGLHECTASEVPIPNGPGQHATTYVYYRPDGGEAGVAYLNAAWGGIPATTTSVVYAGAGASNISLELTPEPGSIGLHETSTLTAIARYSGGGPVTTGAGSFYVYKGGGQIIEARASFTSKSGEIETVYTSVNSSTGLRDSFSLAYPIIKITSITAIGGGFTWNGQAVIEGSSVTLVDQEFPEDTIPITVVYTWGGLATAKYRPGGVDKLDDKIYCGFRHRGHNVMCEITIGTGSAGKGSLSIQAVDSSLAYSESTTLILTAANQDGSAASAIDPPASLTLVDRTSSKNCSLGSTNVRFGTKTLSAVEGSVNSLTTFSVPYAPTSAASFTDIEFLSVHYTAKSINGTTVEINETFPITTGTLTCNYTAKGYGEATFNAGTTDGTAYVLARWAEADPDTETLTISASGSGADGNLSISPDDSSLGWAGQTTIRIAATDGAGAPGSGTVSLSNIYGSTPGSVTLGSKVLTDQKGSINGFKTFTIQYPTSVGSISGITFLGQSYSASSVEGTTVTISGEFPTVTGQVTLDYTAQGYAECTFSAPARDVTCYVTAEWSGADAQACTIDVSEDGGAGGIGISITADPPDLDIRAGSNATESILTVECTDVNGDPVLNGIGISYSFTPASQLNGTFVKPYNQSGELKGSYTAGLLTGELTITARYTSGTQTVQSDAKITIVKTDGGGGGGGEPELPSLTLLVEPSSVKLDEQAIVTATLYADGTPVGGRTVGFEIVPTEESNLPEIGTISFADITNSEGKATAVFRTYRDTDEPGSTTIRASALVNGTSVDTETTITILENPGEIIHKSLHITGELYPDRTLNKELSEGASVLSWGVAQFADEYWCVDLNPDADPKNAAKIHLPILSYIPAGARLKKIEVTGSAVWEPDDAWRDALTHEVDWTEAKAVDALVLWNWEYNSAITTKIYVGDKADPTIPIVGAQVFIAPEYIEFTDTTGFATFSRLPMGSHAVIITHPNYISSDEDGDITNDELFIAAYSQKEFRMNETLVDFTVNLEIELPLVKNPEG